MKLFFIDSKPCEFLSQPNSWNEHNFNVFLESGSWRTLNIMEHSWIWSVRTWINLGFSLLRAVITWILFTPDDWKKFFSDVSSNLFTQWRMKVEERSTPPSRSEEWPVSSVHGRRPTGTATGRGGTPTRSTSSAARSTLRPRNRTSEAPTAKWPGRGPAATRGNPLWHACPCSGRIVSFH